MRTRCHNPNCREYKWYGARGIKVCERWDDLSLFIADMGPRPDGYWLDRINSDGDYCPENCRWATPVEQQANRRNNKWVEYQGERVKLAVLARRLGIPNDILKGRLRVGWSIDRAVTEPIRKVAKRGHDRSVSSPR